MIKQEKMRKKRIFSVFFLVYTIFFVTLQTL